MRKLRITELAAVVAIFSVAASLEASAAPGGPVNSQASSAGVTRPAAKPAEAPAYPWDSKEYRACEQGCLYEKANETITLQALYLFRKLQVLKALKKAGQSDEAVYHLPPHFCYSQGESSAGCVDRYLKVQMINLRAMQKALLQNNKSYVAVRRAASNLKNGFSEPESLQKLKNHVPFVVTFADLEREYKTMQTLTTDDYQRWSDMLKKPPNPDDFRKIKKMPRNPDQPNGEQILIVDDALDEKAYQEAQKAYAADRQWREATAVHYQDLAGKKDSVPKKNALRDDATDFDVTNFKAQREYLVKNASDEVKKDSGKKMEAAAAATLPKEKGKDRTPAAGAPTKAEPPEPMIDSPAGSKKGLTQQLEPQAITDWINALSKP